MTVRREGDEDAARTAGKAPGGVGLLLIDVINPMDFEGAERLAPNALAASAAVAGLIERARRLKTPVIYVNDNYGRWGDGRDQLVEDVAAASDAARRLIQRLAPEKDDFLVVKPRFSGFYATNLPVLLPALGVSRLVLAGFAADICVLFTAGDAHMREYGLWVPRDAVAAEQDQHADWALHIMQKSMGAEIAPTSQLDLADWVARPPGQGR
jgi:nicotinamidase-related amidase